MTLWSPSQRCKPKMVPFYYQLDSVVNYPNAALTSHAMYCTEGQLRMDYDLFIIHKLVNNYRHSDYVP